MTKIHRASLWSMAMLTVAVMGMEQSGSGGYYANYGRPQDQQGQVYQQQQSYGDGRNGAQYYQDNYYAQQTQEPSNSNSSGSTSDPQKQENPIKDEATDAPMESYEKSAEDGELPPLPDGWIELIDPASGMPYYYNADEGVTTWDRPVAPESTADESKSSENDGKNAGGESDAYMNMDMREEEKQQSPTVEEPTEEVPPMQQQPEVVEVQDRVEATETSPKVEEVEKPMETPTEYPEKKGEMGYNQAPEHYNQAPVPHQQQPQATQGGDQTQEGQQDKRPWGIFQKTKEQQPQNVGQSKNELPQMTNEYPQQRPPSSHGQYPQGKGDHQNYSQGEGQTDGQNQYQQPPQQMNAREETGKGLPQAQYQPQPQQQQQPSYFHQQQQQQQGPPMREQKQQQPPNYGYPTKEDPRKEQQEQKPSSPPQQQQQQQPPPSQYQSYGEPRKTPPFVSPQPNPQEPKSSFQPRQQPGPMQRSEWAQGGPPGVPNNQRQVPGPRMTQPPPQQQQQGAGGRQIHQQNPPPYWQQQQQHSQNQYGNQQYGQPQQQYPGGGQLQPYNAAQQADTGSTVASVKEAVGGAWQNVLGFGNRTKSNILEAADTVAQSASQVGQSVSTTSFGIWGKARASVENIGKSFFDGDSQEPKEEYSLSPYGGKAPPPPGMQQQGQQGQPQQQYPSQNYGGYPPRYGPPGPRVNQPYPHQAMPQQQYPPRYGSQDRGPPPQGGPQSRPPLQSYWGQQGQQGGQGPPPPQQAQQGPRPGQGQGAPPPRPGPNGSQPNPQQWSRPQQGDDPSRHPGWSGY